MNDAQIPVRDVLEGIERASAAGLEVKINAVIRRGVNDMGLLDLVRRFKGTGHVLRFIEYMDVGATNGWRMDEVLPSADVVKLIHAQLPLVQLEPSAPGETAERWGYADGNGKHAPQAGEIGVISSVTQAFCGDCNRARLSTEGQLYLCLFATRGHDLKALLRGGATDEDLASAIGHIWNGRDDRYSQLRSTLAPDTAAGLRRVEMSYIGG
jgi:cyclic pyranopterin phosphate synthase